MLNFQWFDKLPSDHEILWDMLQRKIFFSTWFVMLTNYKLPQVETLEYVFMDGRVRLNLEKHQAHGRENKKWAPYAVVDQDITPVVMAPIDQNVWDALSKTTPAQWEKLVQKLGFELVEDLSKLYNEAYYHKKAGRNVYKNPKWDQFICPQEWWISNMGSLCHSEKWTPAELLENLR